MLILVENSLAIYFRLTRLYYEHISCRVLPRERGGGEGREGKRLSDSVFHSSIHRESPSASSSKGWPWPGKIRATKRGRENEFHRESLLSMNSSDVPKKVPPAQQDDDDGRERLD